MDAETRSAIRQAYRVIRSGLEAAADADFLWSPGETLRVRILDGTAKMKARVENIAKRWERYANLIFDFNDHHDTAQIRVSFNARDPGHWSWVGTQALRVTDQNEPTLSLTDGWNDAYLEQAPEDVQSAILHEFGHAIGLIHEHQSPGAAIPWNLEKVYAFYAQTQGWSREQTYAQVLQPAEKEGTLFTQHDPTSIMQYPVPAFLTDGQFSVGWNVELSEVDKAFVQDLYPFGSSGRR